MSERVTLLHKLTQGEASPARRPRWWSSLLKRGFDLWVSISGLVVLWPVFLLIAVRIKANLPGPVFYKGSRSGKGGKFFNILKFRTMYEQPESYNGPRVTAKDDTRVTRFGRFLRDTKLNELPQLWNVLVGEMSLVGPRPEDPQIARGWPKPAYQEVLSVRPGITSPASVLYRNEESLLNAGQAMDTYLEAILPGKLRLDQLYVRHRSFLLDLDVLFWTFLILLPRLGAYAPPEESLFWGPLSRLVRRYVSWFMIDVLVTLTAIGLTGLFWRSFGPINIGWAVAIGVGLGFSLLFSLVGAVIGVNRITWSTATALDAIDLLPAVVVATLAALGLNQLLGAHPLIPVGMVLMAAALAFMGYVVARYRVRLIGGIASRWLAFRGGALAARERVLIVGSGDAGQFVSWMLHNGREGAAFHVAGFVDDDLYKQNTRIRGVQVLGRRAEIPQLVRQYDIGIIVFAIHNISTAERSQVLELCADTPARVVMVPDILGALNGMTPRGEAVQDSGVETTPEEKPLACQYCLARVSSAQMDAWLAELTTIAGAGDTAALQARIHHLRRQLRVADG